MAGEEYVKGVWRDAAGGTYPMRIKKKWGDHGFTEKELDALFDGGEISFSYKNGNVVTGHLQYFDYEGKECFGFVANFNKQYVKSPVYRPGSLFKSDLKNSDVMAEYMDRNYYGRLRNRDGSPCAVRRITDIEGQKKGVDVILTRDGRDLLIDEKAQMDYIALREPLPTFALELLNGKSGKEGWFVNGGLETTYYLFLWPHAATRDVKPDDIEYVLYALVDKKKLQREIESRLHKTKGQLLEYARRFVRDGKMGEPVGDGKSRKFKQDGFYGEAYLYYTLHKEERPVNLVVARSLLERISEEHGRLGRGK